MRSEVINLIDTTTSAYKEFSVQKTDIASRIESLATEAAEQDTQILQPLPEFADGPDTVSQNLFLGLTFPIFIFQLNDLAHCLSDAAGGVISLGGMCMPSYCLPKAKDHRPIYRQDTTSPSHNTEAVPPPQ